MKFRKKPVVIEAIKVKDAIVAATGSYYSLPLWLQNGYLKGEVVFQPDSVAICTLEGWMNASFEDWLIQGVKGEIYPCKPDIFELTYEKAE